MRPVALQTERLELSIPKAADVDAIQAACQDPLIQRYTTVPTPYERQHAEAFIAKAAGWWESGSDAVWALRNRGRLAGMLGMHHLGTGSGEIGYWLAPEARGRAFVAEAARAVIDWSLDPDTLALARIEWRAVAGNVASARIARTLGFRFEGTMRAALVNGAGERFDGWIAGLLPGDDRTRQPWPVLAD